MNPEQISVGVPIQPKSKLESWAFGILTAIIFLVPIAFLPLPYLQQSAVKGYIVIFGVLTVAILYIISRLKARSFEWISHPLVYIGIALGILLLASSISSGSFMKSFFGLGYEYSTAAFLIILGISARLSALFSSRGSKHILTLYTAIICSFAVLVIFQIVKLIAPSAVSFGLFSGATSTLIGSWYDLGIFSGIVFILSSLAFI